MRPDRPFLCRLAATALLAVLALAAPSLALAEDPPAKAEDPAAAYAAALKKLPAPAKEHGFFFQGVLRINGTVLGYARLAAGPAHAEDAAWIASDQFVMKGKAVEVSQSSQAWLDRGFGLLRGTSRTNRDGGSEITWKRAEGGFEIEEESRKETEDGPAAVTRSRAVAHEGTAVNTMAATVLFARLVLPTKAVYRTSVLEPEDAMKGDDAQKPPAAVQAMTLEVLGEQDFQGTTVLAVRATKEDKELHVLFHAKTRDVVAMRLIEGQTRLEILPGDEWVMPAATPVGAGMKALLGFAAKELRILDQVIHWETLYGEVRKSLSEEDRAKLPDIETWRKHRLAQWGKRPQAAPATMMKQLIASQKTMVKTEPLDGPRMKVTFPEMLRGAQFIVQPFDGVWYVVGFPSKPKKDAPKKDAPKKDQPQKAAEGDK